MAIQKITISKSITDRSSGAFVSYLKDVAKTYPLTSEEELDLAKKSKEGNVAARNKLIEANLRFVITVAKKYQGRGLTLEDLVGFGNEGLIKAANTFDPERELKFISYAVWWIRQSILKALSTDGSNIRLPSSQIDPLRKIYKFEEEFIQKNMIPPSPNDIADGCNLSIEKVIELQNIGNNCISTNTTIADNDECILEDTLTADEFDVFRSIDQNSPVTPIEKMLNTLSDRDHDLLCMFFGLCGVPKMSFEEIGRLFAVTAERVRQMREQTLATIRSNKMELIKKFYAEHN